MTQKRRFLELVMVSWIDSEAQVGWSECSDSLSDFQLNHSVGYLIGQDPDKYVLAADYDPEGDHFNRVMRIPRVCVKNLRTITIIPIKQNPS